MKIGEKMYAQMPAEIQALFEKCHNHGRTQVEALFPVTKSGAMKPGYMRKNGHTYPLSYDKTTFETEANSGSAARFFKSCPFEAEDAEAQRLVYFAKASKRDRDEGCEKLEKRWAKSFNGKCTNCGGNCVGTGNPCVCGKRERDNEHVQLVKNNHPTVKSTPLMRYLCRLITPPGGTVLDCFMGSGSTGKGAVLEGFNFVGIEKEAEYFEIAKARIEWAEAQAGNEKQLKMFGG